MNDWCVALLYDKAIIALPWRLAQVYRMSVQRPHKLGTDLVDTCPASAAGKFFI